MTDLPTAEITILKAKDVKKLRDELLAEQKGKCLICDTIIEAGKANLDHNHVTGHVRGVLCKICNTGEGAIVRAARHRYAKRNHMCWTDTVQFIRRIIDYWNREQLPYIHPTYSIELGKQKKVRRKRKTKK